MSGNPFRKASAGGGGKLPLRIQAVPPRDEITGKRIKKVQFVSPIASPEDYPRQPWPDSDTGTGTGQQEIPDVPEPPHSPPPTGLKNEEAAMDTKALLRGDLTAGGAVNISEPPTPMTPNTPMTFMNPGRSGPPMNPFARTLATMEPEQRAATVQQVSTKAAELGEQSGAGKSTMDVDAFKRMLMTGNAGVSIESGKTDTHTSTQAPEVPIASNRQVGHDTVEEQQPESPRSSLESASSEEDEATSVHHTRGPITAPLVISDSPSSSTSTLGRPKAPESHHGKTINTNGPQTVSFDDFDSAFSSMPAQQSSKPYREEFIRPTLSRQSSDLNKPLPMPPSGLTSGLQMETPMEEQGHQKQANASESAPLMVAGDINKKAAAPPPPPPQARRGPQTKPRTGSTSTLDQPYQNRSRSGSNLSQVSLQSEDSSNSRSSYRPAPVPPPRRNASVSSVGGDAASETSSIREETTPTLSGSKMRPPPPPSRHPGKPIPPQRTPSSQSTSSVASRRVSVHGLAPPPPPPPRRGVARTGTDDTTRRSSSIHSAGSDRKDSVSSLQRTEEERNTVDNETKDATAAALPNDMLADLEAFQREVDALHAQASRNR